jgi:hypothetical protein
MLGSSAATLAPARILLAALFSFAHSVNRNLSNANDVLAQPVKLT